MFYMSSTRYSTTFLKRLHHILTTFWVLSRIAHLNQPTPILNTAAGLCSPGPMFPGSYVSRDLCSLVPMWPFQKYVTPYGGGVPDMCDKEITKCDIVQICRNIDYICCM